MRFLKPLDFRTRRFAWLAAALLALPAASSSAAFAQSAPSSPSPGQSAPVHASFENGASSTGWIDFDYYAGGSLFVPVKINGHAAVVILASGVPVSLIDKTLVASLGLSPKEDLPATAGQSTSPALIRGLQIQIGGLILRDLQATAADFAPSAKRLEHPVSFLMGDDLFNEVAVDIDFAHHRIAFRAPASLTKPAGAVEVPLRWVGDTPTVPVSVKGGPPVPFFLGLGNTNPLLVCQSYYQTHKLLEGRRVSQRLAGGGPSPSEPVATLSQVEFAGVHFRQVPSAFVPDILPGPTANLLAGNIGLGVLSHFHLLIDYSHDRLYATPYPATASVPFVKDRLGLVLSKQDAGFVVEFVSPGSPAQAAGFRVGDQITLLNQKPAPAWPAPTLDTLRYAATGTTVAFTLASGEVRQVKLADFF